MSSRVGLQLFDAWRRGAMITAGTGVEPANPVVGGPRVVRRCADGSAWCIGATPLEADDRLAEHRQRCHV